MKARPFGSLAWGLTMTLALGLIFTVSTVLFLSISAKSPPRDSIGSNERIGRIAMALGDVAPPALAMGRFVATGQADDMRTYLNAVVTLQGELRAVATAFAGRPATLDAINQLDQQLVRAITAGRQVLSQPGNGLLNAGGPGSAEQIGAAALASVKNALEDMLKGEADGIRPTAPSAVAADKPEYRVWFGGWGALGAVMALFLLITALRQDDPGSSGSSLAAGSPHQRTFPPAAGRGAVPAEGMLANVARQLELAHLDSLTGLMNRQALAPTVEKAIERSLTKGATIGMIYVEVEGFKALRQQLGPSLSNAVIIEVGRQLKETFRRGDEVARLKDAEFAVVVAEISSRNILQRLEERIQEAIADIGMPALHGTKIKANIGLAMYPIDGYSDRDLLETARNAVLYRAGESAVEKAAEIATPRPEPQASVPVPVPVEHPREHPPESIETHVDASLAELHALIGKYLQAEQGSAEKQAQAQVLIGEFKRRT